MTQLRGERARQVLGGKVITAQEVRQHLLGDGLHAQHVLHHRHVPVVPFLAEACVCAAAEPSEVGVENDRGQVRGLEAPPGHFVPPEGLRRREDGLRRRGGAPSTRSRPEQGPHLLERPQDGDRRARLGGGPQAAGLGEGAQVLRRGL